MPPTNATNANNSLKRLDLSMAAHGKRCSTRKQEKSIGTTWTSKYPRGRTRARCRSPHGRKLLLNGGERQLHHLHGQPACIALIPCWHVTYCAGCQINWKHAHSVKKVEGRQVLPLSLAGCFLFNLYIEMENLSVRAETGIN